MLITIDHDGEERQVDIDLRLGTMSLQELVRLEEALGPDRFERLTETEDVRSPKVLQAIIWTKIVTHYPSVTLDGFDLDLGALAPILAEQDRDGLVIPMSTSDGDVEAVVGKAPPTSASG